jgi:hypothetical protein
MKFTIGLPMKCGPIYKQASLIADGQYDGTMTGYEVKFKTETGDFMTRTLHYGIRGMNVPVVVTIKGNDIEVEVKE